MVTQSNETSILIRIKRQDRPESKSYWQEFEIEKRPAMNVISLLREIQKNPVTLQGHKVSAPVWENSCLEEVCGACTMVVNGRVMQSCSALVDNLKSPITLEPMSKFPVVRDLIVNRSRMFQDLKRVKAWIPIDGTYDLGPGTRMSEKERLPAYELSRCMTCGCCMEVCPQYQKDNNFVGPAVLSQVKLFNTHPTGKMNADERLDAIMGNGGIEDCGNAQNCVRVCPKEIPLTYSIAALGRATTIRYLKRIFER
jgi:succinate dehydrogenase / fumarate reductase iron-sulfur subunit